MNTGRPAKSDSDRFYRSAYIDESIYPKYPFGYGLSYTQFQYSNIRLAKKEYRVNEKIEAIITVANTGAYDGEEVVQLYIRDITASVVRPVKELKGFQKIFLKKGEVKDVRFTLTTDDLRFYNDRLQFIYEPGEFRLYIGGNSSDVQETNFELKK